MFVRDLTASTVHGVIRLKWLPPMDMKNKVVNVSYYFIRVRKRTDLSSDGSLSTTDGAVRQKVFGNKTTYDFAGNSPIKISLSPQSVEIGYFFSSEIVKVKF